MENDKQAVIRRINGLLKEKLPLLAPQPGIIPTAIEGVSIYRMNEDTVINCFTEPCLGVVVQGNKRAVVADEEYRYSEGWYIAYGVDLPAITHIMGATPEKPHLALSIHLDRYILTQLAPEIPSIPAAGAEAYRGVMVAEVSADLLDACLRLVGLLETPERIPVLAPMIIREIHYFLLMGPEGEFFRLLGTHQTVNNQIAQAVSWLRTHYREAFNLSELVGQANMSQASFCRHFSRITGMSPIRFQKRLRLYEAQRLMLTEDKSAETAAYEVGYESPNQFNREYKRQFGEPPRRDIDRLLAAGATIGDETGAVSSTGV